MEAVMSIKWYIGLQTVSAMAIVIALGFYDAMHGRYIESDAESLVFSLCYWGFVPALLILFGDDK